MDCTTLADPSHQFENTVCGLSQDEQDAKARFQLFQSELNTSMEQASGSMDDQRLLGYVEKMARYVPEDRVTAEWLFNDVNRSLKRVPIEISLGIIWLKGT